MSPPREPSPESLRVESENVRLASELHSAEARASVLAARFESLMVAVRTGVLFEDRDGRIAYTNPSLQKLFPACPVELTGGDRVRWTESVAETFVESPRFLDLFEYRDETSLISVRLDLVDGRTLECDRLPIRVDSRDGRLWLFRDVTADELVRRSSEEQRHRMEILHAISIATLDEKPDTAIAAVAVEELARRYPHLRASFGRLDASGRLELLCERGSGRATSREGRIVDLSGLPDIWDRLLSRRLHVIPDLLAPAEGTIGSEVDDGGARAALRAPVSLANGGLGLLALDSPTAHTWSEDEMLTTETTAAHLTVALADANDRELRRSAERALAERESEHVGLLGHLTGMAYHGRADDTWSLVYATDGALELTGYSARELVDGPGILYALVHEDDRESVEGNRRRAIAAGVPWSVEYRIRTRDGGEKWIWEQASPARGVPGQAPRIDGFLADVTDRKRAAAAREELKRVLEQAARDWTRTFDAAETPIFLVDQSRVVLRLNRAALDLCASRIFRDAHGARYQELGSSPLFRDADRVLDSIFGEGRSDSLHIFDPETRRHWHLTGSPEDSGGGPPRRAVLIAKDVTDTVELQESLRETELMSALGSLVAGVSHEVRNPLFAISATLDAFEEEFGVREEYAPHIRVLRKQVERMTNLMTDLLEYGRPAPRDREAIVLDDVARSVVDESRTSARDFTIELALGGLDARTTADVPGLRSVFQNLIDNALQHSEAGGRLFIRTEIENSRGVRVWAFVVEDSGPGFRSEDLQHLFEPFFTRRRGGTGMGLAIVRKVVRRHGGEIEATNRAGGGARVVVRIPI